MKVEILPNYRLAYMRRVGPYGPGNNEVMARLMGIREQPYVISDPFRYPTG